MLFIMTGKIFVYFYSCFNILRSNFKEYSMRKKILNVLVSMVMYLTQISVQHATKATFFLFLRYPKENLHLYSVQCFVKSPFLKKPSCVAHTTFEEGDDSLQVVQNGRFLLDLVMKIVINSGPRKFSKEKVKLFLVSELSPRVKVFWSSFEEFFGIGKATTRNHHFRFHTVTQPLSNPVYMVFSRITKKYRKKVES